MWTPRTGASDESMQSALLWRQLAQAMTDRGLPAAAAATMHGRLVAVPAMNPDARTLLILVAIAADLGAAAGGWLQHGVLKVGLPLLVGCALNTFIRRSDVVKIAAIAQLVNVIAPIMTVPGGAAWKQTTYYPYYYASRYGRGTALNLAVQCPGYDSAHGDDVPYVDVSAVRDEKAGTITVFAVNRHPSEDITLDLTLNGFSAPRVIEHKVMTHPNLEAVNSAERHNRWIILAYR